MTPSLCLQLDTYLDGDLPEADARTFEAHAAACEDCSADLAAARLLDAEWASLAAITSPPGLADAAIQAARRGAADRQPVASPRRRYGRWVGVATVAVLLVALASSVLWMSRDTPSPTAPALATTEPTAPIDTTSTPLAEAAPAPEESEGRQPEAAAPAPSSRPAPRPTPRPRALPPTPEDTPREPLVAQAPPDSVAQARDDLMLALSLVADAQSRAGSAVTSELERATGALTETNVF